MNEVLVALKAQPRNWASEITAAWQKSVESIFAVGDLLVDAKTEMGPEALWSMVQAHKLPFGRRTAERLIVIAKDERLRATHGSLPASWRTLYELTRLSDAQFDDALKNEVINADMERDDAVALLPPRRPTGKQRMVAAETEPPVVKVMPDLKPSAEVMKAEIAKTETETNIPVLNAVPKHGAVDDDGLDVPPCLRRESNNPITAAWDRATGKQRRDFVLARKQEILFAEQADYRARAVHFDIDRDSARKPRAQGSGS